MEGTYMFCKQESVLQAARLLSKVEKLSLQVSAPLPSLSSASVFHAPLSPLHNFLRIMSD